MTEEPAKKQLPKKRPWRPLDVRTWFEGYLRLIGWILVIVLAVVTGLVWIMYELKVLNKHDIDFRDLYFDQRITNDINNRYHQNFLLAETCCNPDPVVFPYTCDTTYASGYSPNPPFCKPLIMMECTDIRSAACNSTREVLYASVGLTTDTGQYSNCLRAGVVRVGAQSVGSGRPITLVAYYQNVATGDTLVVQNPFNINTTQVQEFVTKVGRSVDPADVYYVQPSTRLSSSVFLAGTQASVAITQRIDNRRGLRAPPPWDKVSNLWPWPGMNARCENSAVNAQDWITGSVVITIPAFSLTAPDDAMLTVSVAGSELLVAAWNVTWAAQDMQTVGGSNKVSVAYLSALTVAVGQVTLAGPCNGWQLSPDPNDLTPVYTPFWDGTYDELRAGVPLGPLVVVVTINVADVGGPRRIQLPMYGGMWYIWNAFLMAFIWMVSNGLMLFIIILVWWNVRSNRGLPPITYRYMQKYRGW